MGSLRVVRASGPATVQDRGRPGWTHLGVSASGAADPVSLAVGNVLVGNEEAAAAVELTLVGGDFAFDDDAVLALTGSTFTAWIEQGGARLDLPPWTSVAARAGSTLRIGAAVDGARGYLCVGGAIDVPRVLGSASTHLASGLGGHQGRPLRTGDRLRFGGGGASGRRVAETGVAALRAMLHHRTFRATAGPHQERFGAAATAEFFSARFVVSEQSDRMGIRLDGAEIRMPAEPAPMTTEGMPLGAIQIPEGGRPIVLFVEHQTTGGYPVIAGVIAADLPALAHLRPRDTVRFEQIALAEAWSALRERERLLATLEIVG